MMPVYDAIGNPVAALTAIDTLIDDGTIDPLGVQATANYEYAYNSLQALFSAVPAITLDGTDNITITTLQWKALMHWATQGYSVADDYNSTAALDYIMLQFQEQANTNGRPQPYWRNVQGVILTIIQPDVIAWLIYVLRAMYKASGNPPPIQVP